jgi:hypothetical protein
MKDCRIESKLLFAHNAINNALRNTNIKDRLVAYGYDDSTLKSGRTLYEEAQTLHKIQIREYGEQLFITDKIVQARAESHIRYKKHLKLARIVLKEFPATIEVLWLNEAHECSLFGWIDQASRFYNSLLSVSTEIGMVLDKVGLCDSELKEGLCQVEAVERRINERLKKGGVAHQAIRERDEAFDEMNVWVTDFVEVASIALESKPQYLEILGLCHK